MPILKYAFGSRASVIGPRIEEWIDNARREFTSRDVAEAVSGIWTESARQLLSSVRGILSRLESAGRIVFTGLVCDRESPFRNLRSYAPSDLLTSEQIEEARSRPKAPSGGVQDDGTRVHYARYGTVRITSSGSEVVNAEVSGDGGWRSAVILRHDPRSNGTAWLVCDRPNIKTVLSILGTRGGKRREMMRVVAVDELHTLDVRKPYVHKVKSRRMHA